MVGVCDAATPPMIRAISASSDNPRFVGVGTVCNCPLSSSDGRVLSGKTEPVALCVTL
jgi:hypothetical protein